jgi:hypothetical protein
MFKRLIVGIVIGIVMGALAAAAVVKGLAVTSFLDRSMLAYVAALATGAFVGLVAGKPVWAKGAWIEVGLKAFFGSLLAAGGMFALRKWGGMSLDLSAIGAGAGQIRDLPTVTLPVIATVLSVLYEVDNTESPAESGSVAKAGHPLGPALPRPRPRPGPASRPTTKTARPNRSRPRSCGADAHTCPSPASCSTPRPRWCLSLSLARSCSRRRLRCSPSWLCFAYLALISAGVFALRLRMFVDALDPRDRAELEGSPSPSTTGPIPKPRRVVLEALDAEHAKATFFVIAKKAEAHPELVREMKRRGHAIGLHSYTHDRFFALRSQKRVTRDLARGVAVLTAITGEHPVLFRPPIGHTNPAIARVAEALDLRVVGWNLSARDGLGSADPEKVVARVRRYVKDGTIVLLHDAAEGGGRVPAGGGSDSRNLRHGQERATGGGAAFGLARAIGAMSPVKSLVQ